MPHTRGSAIQIHDVTDFNLSHTLESGQSFRWYPRDGQYYGVIECRLLRIHQEDRTLIVESSAEEDFTCLQAHLCHYLDLNRDLPKILKAVDRDSHIHQAIKAYWGMRILNQELWECLVSFILSQNNNVPRIKGIIQRLSARFGEKIALDDHVDHSFPSSEALAEAGVEALCDCGTGYRAPYVWSVSAAIAEGTLDLENLKRLPYAVAKQELMQFKGIGEKVADCVCLFSLGHMEALPIDVWVKRIIEQIYLGRQASIHEIRKFGEDYFGEHLGYAQQYLFHHARTIGLEKMKSSPCL